MGYKFHCGSERDVLSKPASNECIIAYYNSPRIRYNVDFIVFETLSQFGVKNIPTDCRERYKLFPTGKDAHFVPRVLVGKIKPYCLGLVLTEAGTAECTVCNGNHNFGSAPFYNIGMVFALGTGLINEENMAAIWSGKLHCFHLYHRLWCTNPTHLVIEDPQRSISRHNCSIDAS